MLCGNVIKCVVKDKREDVYHMSKCESKEN